MKTFLRSVSGIQWVCASLLTLGIAASSYQFQHESVPERSARYGQHGGRKEEKEERKRPDRPDLALMQEVNSTRDPATGTVPRERLLVAEARAEQLLAIGAQQRTTGVLSAATWTDKGPSNVGGRTRAILVDPSDATGNKVWASSVGGGLWKSNNAAGATPTWTAVNNFFANLAITTLVYDPGNTDVMYFGTGEGFYNADGIRGLGIWKSTDHGVSWSQLSSTSNSTFHYVQRLAVAPNGYVYAATRTGLHRSTDGGASWTRVLGSGIGSTVNQFGDVKVSANGTIYLAAGLIFSANDGIYRSTDNGTTWTKLTGGLPTTGFERIELACAPSDANRLYAIFQSSATRGVLDIYRSQDGGTTWNTMSKPTDADNGIGTDFTRGQGWYDLSMAVSPTDPNTLFIGGIDLFKTTNAGAATATDATWQQITHWYGGFGFQNVHADQHAITFVPGSSTHAYFGNDGGLFRTTNATAAIPTLNAINTNYNVTQFYAVAVHPTDVNYFLAGAQDNGTQRYTAAGGQVTTEATGGDGAFCFIDQNEPQYQFTSYVYNQYYRSTNGGASFTGLNFSGTAGQFINPADYDSRSNTLYAAWTVDRLFILPNAPTASSATAPTLATGAGLVSHVTVSPNTQDRVFVGTQPDFAGRTSTQGHLYRVDNATTSATRTITQLYTAPAGMTISSVAVETGNDAHLLVTLSNYSATNSKVVETTGGTTAGTATADAATWTSRQGNLPDMPVRWAVFDPNSNKRALLATELGVWSTEDLTAASPAWSPASMGLANVRVDMLRIRASDKQLVAATHGRGVFTSDVLKNQPLPVELTSFTARNTEAGVAVRWQTSSEKNARHFEVERCLKGQSFQRLTSVAAAGTSTISRTYAYTDADAGRGLYYYRLRQVDNDGTAVYSPVVVIERQASLAPLLTSAYPNPFGPELTLQLREPMSGDITTTLTSVQGRVVYRHRAPSASREFTLPLPASLSPGTYVLTVQAQGQQATRRVIHR